jgi:hypothetical protein
MSRNDATRQNFRTATPMAADTGQYVSTNDLKRMDMPSPGSANFDQRVRETLMVYMGRQGDPLDRGVTLRDLIDTGVVTLLPGYKPGGGTGGWNPGGGTSSNIKPDLTPPPTVTGFTATPGLTDIFFDTDNPTWTMGHGYLQTNIYGAIQAPGAPQPTFQDAQELTSFSGSVGSFATSPATNWHLWAKWKTRDGVESVSPAGGTNGVQAMTGQDVELLISTMTGPGLPFSIVPYDTVINGVPVPAGTYTNDAYIRNGQIQSVMIGNAVIKTAHVDKISVNKISAGVITATEIFSANWNNGVSGFYLNSDGYMQCGNAWIRGGIYADWGYFYGNIHCDANSYIAGDISAAHGIFNGGVYCPPYNQDFDPWPATGQGFHLSSRGLKMGNINWNWFVFDANKGTFEMPGLKIASGIAEFSGALSVNTGGPTRVQITNSQILVFENNNVRVRIGIW